MTGFTKEERFLNNLGNRSFLKFWSWPNLFRDQGDGKEICDLTIIFENNILLFSDKKIKFNSSKDVNVSWPRWARKAMQESIKQIKGARRWFKEYPNRVFTDKSCKLRIPINLPSKEKIKFHNIIVCHGIEEELAKKNEESSFSFDNSISEAEHWEVNKCKPFCVGKLSEGDFVHVFNEATIDLVLREFDTVVDFLSYLEQRETLLNSRSRVLINAESDIIKIYYNSYNSEIRKRSLEGSAYIKNNVIIDMGGINELYQNYEFNKKKEEDRISYFWDDLIESFSFHILNNTSEHINWSHPSEIEPSIRMMANTGRLERRVLSKAFMEFYHKFQPGQRGSRILLSEIKYLAKSYTVFFTHSI